MKKTKVGMITIYQKNYGAFLQAYALQQLLEQCGYEPEIIRYDYFKDHCFIGIPLSYMKQPVRFIKMVLAEIIKYRSHHEKTKSIQKSTRKYLIESAEYFTSYKQLAQHPPCYDIYITGSDQVFNMTLSPQARKARLLEFVKNGIKASYAASSGSNSINDKYIREFLTNIQTFDAISVREYGLCDTLKNKYQINASCHLDPTLVLNEKIWQKFAKLPNELYGKKYIFYYRIAKQKEVYDEAVKLSKQLNLPIVVADANESFDNSIKIQHIISPEEWVGLIANSEYVVTNSFHGTAFSIKLNKKVRTIIPEHGKDRIISILEKCDLMMITQKDFILPDDCNKLYRKARYVFETEYKRTIDYLMTLCRE